MTRRIVLLLCGIAACGGGKARARRSAEERELHHASVLAGRAAVAPPAPPQPRPALQCVRNCDHRVSFTADPEARTATITTTAPDADGQPRVVAWIRISKDRSALAFQRCVDGPVFSVVADAGALTDAITRSEAEGCYVRAAGDRVVSGQAAEDTYERARANECCRVCFVGAPCGDTCIAADLECHEPAGCAC